MYIFICTDIYVYIYIYILCIGILVCISVVRHPSFLVVTVRCRRGLLQGLARNGKWRKEAAALRYAQIIGGWAIKFDMLVNFFGHNSVNPLFKIHFEVTFSIHSSKYLFELPFPNILFNLQF